MSRYVYLRTGVFAIALSAAGAVGESKAFIVHSSSVMSQTRTVVEVIRLVVRANNQEWIMTVAERPTVATKACAERDLRVITAIEERGSIGDMTGQSLAEATFAMVRARIECADGREREALARYDQILIGLARTQASGH